MTADIHSIGLLNVEIGKEEKALTEDQAELATLERGLRDSEAMRQLQEKGLHPLASLVQHDESISSSDNNEPVQQRINQQAWMDDAENDENLKLLLKQFKSHLESMHHNTENLVDISKVLPNAQAALNMFTARALQGDDYSRLLHLKSR